MTVVRYASCQCGQLTATCAGDPVRVSVCHCLDCQRRSGSAFAAQARFPADRVQIAGTVKTWRRTADSGAQTDFHFCPDCGSTVYYQSHPPGDLIAIPLGAFADPAFPAPGFSVYECRRHAWVAVVADEHHE